MERVKQYLVRHFEQAFVLFLLISVVIIYYFLPHKLAFLNFYFIPILVAAHYLDHRRTVLGSIFCILIVAVYAFMSPHLFSLHPSPLNLTLHIAVWGGFLVLTGATVGILQERLKKEMIAKYHLEEQLAEQSESLEEVTKQLTEHSEHLEEKVSERTVHLAKAKEALEDIKERVEEALYSTMDPSVVKLMIEKKIRTEKRIISILFADLKSFTAFSEQRHPEMVVTQLNTYFSEMENALLRYGAHIDKYMGDGIMAEFGAPVGYDRHALMAVMAALEMQKRGQSRNFPLQMRIGIATGEAIIGLIGQKRQTYTALGDVVNVASRIEGICAPGGVTVDEVTCESVKQFFHVKNKTMQSLNRTSDGPLKEKISRYTEKLHCNPEDPTLHRELGLTFMEMRDYPQAYSHLQSARLAFADDKRLQQTLAECSRKLNESQDIHIRGKKLKLRLYDITGLKDPLLDVETVPEHLQRAYREKVDSIMEHPQDIIHPIEAIDGTIGHSRVVGFLSYALADALGLPDKEKQDVLLAGYYCDIGKTIIPHQILNRIGALTDKEFEELTKHCRESARVLKKMGYENENTFETILHHHENFNGTGYPAGLAGEAIPIGSRIVAVADTYDALTSWRPFRNRWDYPSAFAEMERASARGKYDPQVITALGKLLGLH
jgi:HD-GYP domain-containing protein (c-di-GMP phosphodiesterase class II)